MKLLFTKPSWKGVNWTMSTVERKGCVFGVGQRRKIHERCERELHVFVAKHSSTAESKLRQMRSELSRALLSRRDKV